MKVSHLKLENYKQFRSQEWSFVHEDSGLPKDLIAIIGRNGSGKTSILQAIAATLATATGRIRSLNELQWPGFDLDLMDLSYSEKAKVALQVSFTHDELMATNEFWADMSKENLSTAPGMHQFVELAWKGNTVASPMGEEAYLQLRGREYAKQVLRSHPDGFRVFERVGSPFWYTEQRTSSSLTPENQERLEFTVDLLRDRLSKWHGIHESMKNRGDRKQRDFYKVLEDAYHAVFPERRFAGPDYPRDIDNVFQEPYFNLAHKDVEYEISEMSGGEKAIFPILFDFANWNINNSVILIDEIELHLHPPMQQAFLQALRKMGKNNQFIITTHSDAVYDLIPEDCIYELG